MLTLRISTEFVGKRLRIDRKTIIMKRLLLTKFFLILFAIPSTEASLRRAFGPRTLQKAARVKRKARRLGRVRVLEQVGALESRGIGGCLGALRFDRERNGFT